MKNTIRRSEKNWLVYVMEEGVNIDSSHLPRKVMDVTSRQVSSLPARDMVIWFFTREVSHNYLKNVKVLLSNWKNVTE